MDFDRILCERRRSCCVGSSGLKGESMVTDITRYLQTWSAVGKEAPNLDGDVARIQVLLSSLAGRSGPTLLVDGKVSPSLIGAITAFQRDVMKIEPTGKVEPASATFRALLDAAGPKIKEQTRFPVGNGHRAHLTDADYVHAAGILGCKAEAIKAVSEVESKGAPFLQSGRPKILFEPQIFGEKTGHRYESGFPDISRQHRLPRGHGVHGYGSEEDQWTKLKVAALLDRRSAIESASWGRFQILGKNWMFTGVKSLDAFLAVMFTSERSQLDGFVAFVKSQHLDGPLKRLDWRAFARGYNGAGFHRDNYDGKIAAKYRHLTHPAQVAIR